MPRRVVGAKTETVRVSVPVHETLNELQARMSQDKGRQVYMHEVMEWLTELPPVVALLEGGK